MGAALYHRILSNIDSTLGNRPQTTRFHSIDSEYDCKTLFSRTETMRSQSGTTLDYPDLTLQCQSSIVTVTTLLNQVVILSRLLLKSSFTIIGHIINGAFKALASLEPFVVSFYSNDLNFLF